MDTGPFKHEQSYRLSIGPDDLTLIAGDQHGLYYGFMTLRQLVRQADDAGKIPCVQIEDWPEFPVRGVMLDISRDRVPTMETLKRLIDLWSELKFNQNSFGHMERWLKHDKYSRLSDATGSFVDPWGGLRLQPTTLNPLNPESLHLLSGLYDELLPHFSSNMINVGADEPFDLGQGRSREACEERGLGRVYLEFMLKIHGELSRRGKVMQFYGDIVLHHPQLIQELPRDVIALNWGYEADHPFNKESRMLAEAGLQFYVCPGTSAWNSIGGRWNNARENILSAEQEGRSAGALAVLLVLELQQYHQEELKRLRGHDFAREQAGIDHVLSLLRQADIRTEDADLLCRELTFTADLMAHATRLGKERFATAGLTTAEISVSMRKTLAAEVEALIEVFEKLWLSRSRPGGLKDSAGRMIALKESYGQG